MSEIFLSLLTTYGLGFVALTNGIGRLGPPFPSTFLMLASGAFLIGSPGELVVAITIFWAGAMSGSFLAYWLGHWGSARVLNSENQRPRIRALLIRAQDLSARFGIWAVLFTRWPISPIACAINYLAGAGRMRLIPFLCIAAIGEVIWVGLYTTLGYVFATHLDWVSQTLGRGTAFAAGLVLVVVIALMLRRKWSDKNGKSPDIQH